MSSQFLIVFMTDNEAFKVGFKEHKVTEADLSGVISEARIVRLSEHTVVDHYTKVLHGKNILPADVRHSWEMECRSYCK